jgi:DNA-binding transcriptional MerR regulator
MESGLYQKKQVAEKLAYAGITPRLVQFYTEEGIVNPDKANPSGKGSTRYYSKQNLGDFLIVKELAASGLNLDSIRVVMKEVSRHPARRKYFVPGTLLLDVLEPNTTEMQVFFTFTLPPETIAKASGVEPFQVGSVKFSLPEFRKALRLNVTAILSGIKE